MNARLLWTLLFLAVPIFGVGIFVVSATSYGGWLPDNISEHGKDIDYLFYVILAITGITFVLTEVLLVWAMWTARGQNNGKSTYTHGNHRLEIGWTLATVAILLYVAFSQIPVWSKAKYYSNRPKKTPEVLVTASQFHWSLRYPAWNSVEGKPHLLNTFSPTLPYTFALSNELHVYADKEEPFLVHVQTLDVQHAFWLPAVRVKQDALPGHLIPVWFKIDPEMLKQYEEREKAHLESLKAKGLEDKEIEKHRKVLKLTVPGTDFKDKTVYRFEWTCAELCGWGHPMMRAKLYVHPTKAQYLDWLKAASTENVPHMQAQK